MCSDTLLTAHVGDAHEAVRKLAAAGWPAAASEPDLDVPELLELGLVVGDADVETSAEFGLVDVARS